MSIVKSLHEEEVPEDAVFRKAIWCREIVPLHDERVLACWTLQQISMQVSTIYVMLTRHVFLYVVWV